MASPPCQGNSRKSAAPPRPSAGYGGPTHDRLARVVLAEDLEDHVRRAYRGGKAHVKACESLAVAKNVGAEPAPDQLAALARPIARVGRQVPGGEASLPGHGAEADVAALHREPGAEAVRLRQRLRLDGEARG